MTGERLHPGDFAKLNAVCTHPIYLGSGYAAALMQQVLQGILSKGQLPFLHVRHDNARAIALYEWLGFLQNSPMNFYFMHWV